MTGDFGDLEIEIVTSRRALIDVIIGLADQREALTVLGGHAVMEVTQGIPALPPDDTTRDGDLGVIPQLLDDDPNLGIRMSELGYETVRPERPGVWSPISQRDRSIHDRDSVDLIAPMSLARGDLTTKRSIRAARVGAHGRHAVSATRGTELSVLDRQWRTLRAFDGGMIVDAYVAGPSALLCAKAYKIHDRLDPTELRRNVDRLRPKDFADLYRLLLVIAPEDAQGVFSRGIDDSKIADAVALGRDYLIEILTDAATVASMVADTWSDTSREREFQAHVLSWRRRFVVQERGSECCHQRDVSGGMSWRHYIWCVYWMSISRCRGVGSPDLTRRSCGMIPTQAPSNNTQLPHRRRLTGRCWAASSPLAPHPEVGRQERPHVESRGSDDAGGRTRGAR